MKTHAKHTVHCEKLTVAPFQSHSKRSSPQPKLRRGFLQAILGLSLLSAAPAQLFANPASPGDNLRLQNLSVPYANIEQSEYEIHWQPSKGAYMAPNRAQNLRFSFYADGLVVTPREWEGLGAPWAVTLTLESYGRAGFPGARVEEATWSAVKNTAEVQARGITIDYRNDKDGLRQDFLIHERPAGNGPLRLDFAAQGDGVGLGFDTSQSVVYFTYDKTAPIMQYRDIMVTDASRRPLAGRFEPVDGSHFAIVIDDQDAQYPLLVDPTVGLLSDGFVTGGAGTFFGYSVAFMVYWETSYNTPYSLTNIGGMLVGVPHYDNGSDPDAGKALLYIVTNQVVWNGSEFVTNPVLDTMPFWSYTGTSYELVGWSVADGGLGTNGHYHNILVGAPGGGPYGTYPGTAMAFFPNSSSGTYSTTPNWSVQGAIAGESFGWSVAGCAPFTADGANYGYPSVIVGAPNYPTNSAGQHGEVLVYYDNPTTGYDTTPDWSMIGPNEDGQFGYAVDWGFVNGGSYPALLIGAPGSGVSGSLAGAVYEYLDTSGAVHSSLGATLSGKTSGDHFGYAICSRADQNFDGYQDLLVGAPDATTNSLTGSGIAYLFRGSSGGLSTSSVWSAGGDNTNAQFGASVALGDMNYDSNADVIVGEPNLTGQLLPVLQQGGVDFFITDTSTFLPTNTTYGVRGITCNHVGTSVSYGYHFVNGHQDFIAGLGDTTTTNVPAVDIWYWEP